jgi:hypothetical protein
MEGMEHLLLNDDGLDDDPVLSYTLAQFYHHEAAQTFLVTPSPLDIKGGQGYPLKVEVEQQPELQPPHQLP